MAECKRTLTAYQRQRHRYWQEMILKWRQSGLSQAVFCRQHKLQVQQFSKWKIRLAKVSTGASEPEVQAEFIEVKPSVSRPYVYEIITPDDYRIRIEGAYCPGVLADILSIVSQSC